jgi:hypothetical protein
MEPLDKKMTTQDQHEKSRAAESSSVIDWLDIDSILSKQSFHLLAKNTDGALVVKTDWYNSILSVLYSEHARPAKSGSKQYHRLASVFKTLAM